MSDNLPDHEYYKLPGRRRKNFSCFIYNLYLFCLNKKKSEEFQNSSLFFFIFISLIGFGYSGMYSTNAFSIAS